MKPVRLKIFVSSVQKEFKQIRMDLKAFLLGDAFLHHFVSEVFLSRYGTIMGHEAPQVELNVLRKARYFD